MKRSFLVLSLFLSGALFIASCSDSGDTSAKNDVPPEMPETHGTLIQPGDVQMTTPLNQEWVASGKSIYDMKCQSCHKLTDEKLVGPGWAGITKKRQPDWIMNMITNVDVMLEKDPEAQKLLEQCLVRMPNQNISQEEARSILEYMRSNDGEK